MIVWNKILVLVFVMLVTKYPQTEQENGHNMFNILDVLHTSIMT